MPIRKEYSANPEIGRIYDNVAAVVNPLEADRFYNRQIIDVAITFGDNTISHRLGKLPQGWLVIDQDAISSFYRKSWSSADIVLYSNQVNPMNIRLLIF